MSWLTITILAYFLLSLEIILDKFLLSSERVSHPSVYAFYSGTLGLFAIVFAPFGFHMITLNKAIFSFIAGMIFIYGMLSLFFGIKKGEASRVLPIVGAVVPIVTFILGVFFLKEKLGVIGFWGIVVLIFGGLLISFDLSKIKNEKRFFEGFYSSILAGTFLAISAILIKKLYNEDNFLNVFIWTRTGAFLGVLSLFLIPTWRKAILGSLFKFKKPKTEEKKSGFSFVFAKLLGGCGSFLKENATSMSLASVTIVNALVSLEYVFIFIFGLIFSIWFPRAIQEKKDIATIIQKVLAIIIITTGLVLVYKI